MLRLALVLAFVLPLVGLAQSPAPSPSPASPTVWVNTHSHIYHYAESCYYGNTVRGKYLSEAEALAEGDRPASNEHRHAGVAAPPPAAPAAPSAPALLPTPEPAPVNDAISAEVAPAATETLSTCITAIAAQSDPAKLATLGRRQANPRLKRILYYLAQARAGGADPAEVIDQAQRQNGSFGTPRAPLVKASLLRNLKICDGLAMLDPDNLAKLRRGNAPTVMRGPYTGQSAEVDHIVPLAHASAIGNELANLELLPAALNRAKSDKVGDRQLALARKFHDAGLLTDAELAEVQARYRPAGTQKYELPEQ